MARQRSVRLVGKKKALIIGIMEVQGKSGFGPVHFAHRDARNMKDFLVENFDYKEEDVVLMLDVKGHKKDLLPTKKNILRQIHSLVADATKNDQFFFYYAGHGTQVTCCHNTEDDGLDEVMLTANGKEIMDNLLKDRLVKPLLKVENAKLFALFDCCHSASMLDLRYRQHSKRSSAVSRVICGLTNSIANIFQRRKTESALPAVASVPKRSPHRSLTFDNSSRDGDITNIQRVMSPEQVMGSLDVEPRVISLSACRDSEMAFDDNERQDTMTKFFISALTKNRELTWSRLRTEIRDHIDEMCRRRAEQEAATSAQTECSTDVLDTGRGRNVGASDDIKKSWSHQVPEYTSNRSFDLNDRVDL